MTSTLEDINTIEDTARYLKVSVQLLGHMARTKRIGAMKAGRRWVFPRTVIEEYVASQTQAVVVPNNPWGLVSASRRVAGRRSAA